MSDDATFEELSAAGAIGPAALLLTGYGPAEARAVADLLGRMGCEGHRVVLCTEPMLKMPLADALVSEEPAEPAPPEALPRAMVLSGLSGAEIQAFLTAFDQLALPRPIFASATRANLGFPVRDLLRELLAEDRAMRGRSMQGRPMRGRRSKRRR